MATTHPTRAPRARLIETARQRALEESVFAPNYALEQEFEDGWVTDPTADYGSETTMPPGYMRVTLQSGLPGIAPDPTWRKVQVDPGSVELPPTARPHEFTCERCFLVKNLAALSESASGPVCRDCE